MSSLTHETPKGVTKARASRAATIVLTLFLGTLLIAWDDPAPEKKPAPKPKGPLIEPGAVEIEDIEDEEESNAPDRTPRPELGPDVRLRLLEDGTLQHWSYHWREKLRAKPKYEWRPYGSLAQGAKTQVTTLRRLRTLLISKLRGSATRSRVVDLTIAPGARWTWMKWILQVAENPAIGPSLWHLRLRENDKPVPYITTHDAAKDPAAKKRRMGSLLVTWDAKAEGERGQIHGSKRPPFRADLGPSDTELRAALLEEWKARVGKGKPPKNYALMIGVAPKEKNRGRIRAGAVLRLMRAAHAIGFARVKLPPIPVIKPSGTMTGSR